MEKVPTNRPFILRGVALQGIDSVYRPKADRIEAWKRLATDLDIKHIEAITQEVALHDVIEKAAAQMAGQIRGRLVVNIAG